jgi:hypothetical protein
VAIFCVPTTYIIWTKALSCSVTPTELGVPKKSAPLHKVKKIEWKKADFFSSCDTVWVQFFGDFGVPHQPCSHRIPMMVPKMFPIYHHSFWAQSCWAFIASHFIPIFWPKIELSYPIQRCAKGKQLYTSTLGECWIFRVFLWWANQSGYLQTKGKKKETFAL